jgi:predicted ATPase
MKDGIRVGMCGSAGSGKTALALEVAKRMSIPALLSRDITDSILRRDGYDYGSGIQIERFLANSGRQNEILRRTIEQQSIESFVTDRTVIDLAAYAVCELHHSDVTALRRIVDTCRRNVSVYTHLFLCPWKDVAVGDTKKRTLNPWYQFMIYIIERGILDEWGCKYHIFEDDDIDGRMVKIASFFIDDIGTAKPEK